MKLKLGERNVDYWFSGDWHLGHQNIIKYCNRPFVTIQEMNYAIIENCNEFVKENDVLFYLGDWCSWYGKRGYVDTARDYRERIACKNIYFVFGNHDTKGRNPEFAKLWQAIDEMFFVKLPHPENENESLNLVLSHYALRVWDKSHYGAMNFYGHSHGTLPELPNSLSMDVGIDMAAKFFDNELKSNNYRPFKLEEILKHMKTKDFKPLEHHNSRSVSEV